MSMQKLLAEVLETRKPKKSWKSEIGRFLAELRAELKKAGVVASVELGGSFAKGVWLEGESDVDVFVRFDVKHKNISDELERVLKRWKPERVHGSRDYFQVKDALTFEVVPVLAITSGAEALNVTDYSPLHTAWVNKNVGTLRDDIRLAKLFTKSLGVYGAESYRAGFSGHVLDVLVIHYGGFVKWLKAAVKWEDKTVLDPLKNYRGRALFFLNESKTAGPLVIVDPVDKERNAAAAVGFESFDRLRIGAQKFLQNPTKEAFEEEVIPTKAGENQMLIVVKPTSGKEDVVGAKIRRAFDLCKRSLGQHVQKARWFWHGGDATLLFTVDSLTLPSEIEVQGPPVEMQEHAAAFKKKHKSWKEAAGKLTATVKNSHTSVKALLEEQLEYAVKKEWIVGFRLQ